MSAVGDARERQAEAGREPDLLAALGALADEWERCAADATRRGYPAPGDGLTFAQEKHAEHLRALIAAHQSTEPDEGQIERYYAAQQGHAAHQSERTDTAEACSCGAPDTTSLNPAEVVVHRTDGPCYIAPAQPSEPDRGERDA